MDVATSRAATSPAARLRRALFNSTIGAVMIRIGCWGVHSLIIKNPQNSIGIYLGPYIAWSSWASPMRMAEHSSIHSTSSSTRMLLSVLWGLPSATRPPLWPLQWWVLTCISKPYKILGYDSLFRGSNP